MTTLRYLVLSAVIALLVLADSPLLAQPATTVQLPTFQFFTVSTTVLVPDRGSTHLGGHRQGSLGSSFYSNPYLGPLRQTTANRSSGQMQMSVQIHDLREMDEALLGKGGGAMRPPLLSAANPALAVATPTLNTPTPSTATVSTAELPPAGSVADAVRARQSEVAAADREAREYYEQGLRAEADGKPGLARAYYQMAAGKASATFKLEVLRRSANLPRANSAPRTAQQPRP